MISYTQTHHTWKRLETMSESWRYSGRPSERKANLHWEKVKTTNKGRLLKMTSELQEASWKNEKKKVYTTMV